MSLATSKRPIDWRLLRDSTGNDKAAMVEVVQLYVRQGTKNVKALRSAVRRADPDQIAALAHKLLGSSRFLGATEIGVPLAALVKMGRSRHLSLKAFALVDETAKALVHIDRYVKTSHD